MLQATSRHDLPLTETTLAEHFQKAGYRTALVGKWHLGDAAHFPETQGFDINVGGTHWGATHLFLALSWHRRGAVRWSSAMSRAGEGREGEYLTDRLRTRRSGFCGGPGTSLCSCSSPDHAPHSPLEAKPADLAHFQARLRPEMRLRNATYAAMVKSLDDSVGRVMSELKRTGRDRSTAGDFRERQWGLSGNQPSTPSPGAPTGPASFDDGTGHDRAPVPRGQGLVLRRRDPGAALREVAGRDPEGGRRMSGAGLSRDLFPTLLGAAGLGTEPGVELDTMDLLPLLRDPSASLGRESLFFHYPHYYDASTPVIAVRSGSWKLLDISRTTGWSYIIWVRIRARRGIARRMTRRA